MFGFIVFTLEGSGLVLQTSVGSFVLGRQKSFCWVEVFHLKKFVEGFNLEIMSQVKNLGLSSDAYKAHVSGVD